jgi:hypothetical protein
MNRMVLRLIEILIRLLVVLSTRIASPSALRRHPESRQQWPLLSKTNQTENREVPAMKTTLTLLTALLLTPLAALHAADAAKQNANVILILADDLGAKELSCYGNREHRTPHLDRIAAEGMRFETFFANPLCTPTRVALMTGQYGFHSGFLGMSNPAFVPDKKSPQAEIGNHFTHADLLKSCGYKTALCGKWQLAGQLPTRGTEKGQENIW